MNNKTYIISLNTPINEPVFNYYYNPNSTTLICADGGANRLYQMNKEITPNRIIGDLDSIQPKIMKYYQEKGSQIDQINDQDTTDFEKALIEYRNKELIIFGGLSKRFDQTLYNLHLIVKYEVNGVIIDQTSNMRLIRSCQSFHHKLEPYEKKKGAGIFAAFSKARVATKGFKWNLQFDYPLEFGQFESACNQIIDNEIWIEAKDACLLILEV